MLNDIVVAIIGEDHLNNLLPDVHRQQFGHLVRVIRAERGDPLRQLSRAGIPVQSAPTIIAETPLLVMANSAARSPQFASLCLQHQASAAWIVNRSGAWAIVEDIVVSVVPDREATPLPRQHIPGRFEVPVPPPPMPSESTQTE